MEYIIDKDKNNNIVSIVEVYSMSKTEEGTTYIVDKWKTVWGEEPFSGKMRKLYRDFRSFKSDRQWVEAAFEYWY